MNEQTHEEKRAEAIASFAACSPAARRRPLLPGTA